MVDGIEGIFLSFFPKILKELEGLECGGHIHQGNGVERVENATVFGQCDSRVTCLRVLLALEEAQRVLAEGAHR